MASQEGAGLPAHPVLQSQVVTAELCFLTLSLALTTYKSVHFPMSKVVKPKERHPVLLPLNELTLPASTQCTSRRAVP